MALIDIDMASRASELDKYVDNVAKMVEAGFLVATPGIPRNVSSPPDAEGMAKFRETIGGPLAVAGGGGGGGEGDEEEESVDSKVHRPVQIWR